VKARGNAERARISPRTENLMSTKVSKAAIGAFVLGAIALLVAGVLVFGAGKFFTTEHKYITYFDGSVKGLNVGSPVTFRGVKVGAVTDISIIANPAKRELKIPVIFTLEPEKFKGTKEAFQRDPRTIENAVAELGLRTQLQMQSFVTGQLVVALDFFPDKPAQFVGLNKEYPEIPSIPTPLEQLQKTLADLPLKEIVNNLNATLKQIDRLVSDIDAKKTTQTIEAAIRDVQTLVHHVNEKIDPVVDNLTETSVAARGAFSQAEKTLALKEGVPGEIAASLKETLAKSSASFDQLRAALLTYEKLAERNADIGYSVSKTLTELDSTSRSVRSLADYLERHPESLIKGKQ
jgi:paraquat-inducible protein B